VEKVSHDCVVTEEQFQRQHRGFLRIEDADAIDDDIFGTVAQALRQSPITRVLTPVLEFDESIRGCRVEANILLAFFAYCLLVTLKNRLQALARGLTPRAVLETLAPIQMLDVTFPTTDGRRLVMPRYTP